MTQESIQRIVNRAYPTTSQIRLLVNHPSRLKRPNAQELCPSFQGVVRSGRGLRRDAQPVRQRVGRVHAQEGGGGRGQEGQAADGQAGAAQQGQRDVGEEPHVPLRRGHQVLWERTTRKLA